MTPYEIKLLRYDKLKRLRERINTHLIDIQAEIQAMSNDRDYAQYIINSVANFHKIPVDEMRQKKHDRLYADPRHQAMKLIYNNTNLSTMQVGLLFRKDHSTVLHACRKVETMCKYYADYRRQYQLLEMLIAR